MRRTILALLLALPGASLAQKAVSVHVPPGDCVAFASKGRASEPPLAPVEPKGDLALVSVEEGQDTVYVWARAFNRVASTSVKAGEWTPKTTDLADLAQVVVELRHNGEPVGAANVTLKDGHRRQTRLLDPGAKGDVTFFDVKPGPLEVTVAYRAKKGDAAPVTQIFEASTKGDVPPRFTVSLPEDVATVGSAGPAAPGTVAATAGTSGPVLPGGASTTPAPASSGGGFNFVGTLFALLVGGAAAAGIWYFIKQNPDAVGGTLERLGAQIPKPGDADLADPPVAAAPAPIAPQPPQKIVLDAAPDPIQMAPIQIAPIAMSAPVSMGEPSLVSEAGIPIPLMEGETVVGREVGLGLSLAGETTVSRRHARIVRTGGAATLFDEGSTNGTFVNGQRLSGSQSLNPGDAVQFGSVRFRYEG